MPTPDEILAGAIWAALGIFYIWAVTKVISHVWFSTKKRHMDRFLETLAGEK